MMIGRLRSHRHPPMDSAQKTQNEQTTTSPDDQEGSQSSSSGHESLVICYS